MEHISRTAIVPAIRCASRPGGSHAVAGILAHTPAAVDPRGSSCVSTARPGTPYADAVLDGDTLGLDAADRAANRQWSGHARWRLAILYEDESILVLDKPVGLVVHPAAGHADDTLLNGLLVHCPSFADLPRAGIVHRLDRDTSGVLVVAKTLAAQTCTQRGDPGARGPARVPRDSQWGACQRCDHRPAHRSPSARSSAHGGAELRRSACRDALPRAQRATVRTRLLAVLLETGRTHQIRVHMASAAGFPIVGDPVYGGRARLPRGASPPR
jgi:23S rRNA pseudouridine1911/1915/1917 synthase